MKSVKMASENEDVPPLEDMSEMLEQVNILKQSQVNQNETSSITPKGEGLPEISQNLASTTVPQKPEIGKNTKPNRTLEEKTTISNNKNASSSFGGMKKGFLFGGSSKKTNKETNVTKQTSTQSISMEKTQSNDSDIPLIKPKVSKEEQYTMPEVQEAMKSSQAFLQNKDWVTQDLLSKVMKSDRISQRLSDPKFMQALTEFQTNPSVAMEKYKNNEEMQLFLKEFCGIMGEHFTTLADKQENTSNTSRSEQTSIVSPSSDAELSVHSSTNPNQATAQDERRMQEILSDPEIRDILLDPRIQKIIETLRTDPGRVQKAMHLADKDLQVKIQKLVRCGILQFQG